MNRLSGFLVLKRQPRTIWPGMEKRIPRPWVHWVNKVLAKAGIPVMLAPRFDHRSDMMSLEQAGNLNVLIDGVLDGCVAGDFVEMGSYTGSSAVVIARQLQADKTSRSFHVYDRFDITLGKGHGMRSSLVKVG